MKRKNLYIIGIIAILIIMLIFVLFSRFTYSAATINLIEETEISIIVDQTKEIEISSANLSGYSSDEYTLLWEVDDENVITLSNSTTTIDEPNNSITANEAGICTVTVYIKDTENNNVASDSVSINIIGGGIETNTIIKEQAVTMNTNQITPLIIEGISNDTEVTWSSSDPNVATVENGIVTTTGVGTVTITATYINDDGDEVVEQYNIKVDEENQTEQDHSLRELRINGVNIFPSMRKEITGDSFTIEAVPIVSTDEIKITNIDGNINYNNGGTINWDSEQGTMLFIIKVCVPGEEDNCKSYQLIIEKKSTTTEETNFFESFKINDDSINVETFFECNTEGSQVTCVGKENYTLPAGVNEVTITAPLKSGYSYNESVQTPHTPGKFAATDGMTLQLDIYENNTLVGIYRMTIKTTETNEPSPAKPNDPTKNPDSGVKPSQTGDMSSFLIFIIMIGSLLASMIIYKKNINEK